MDHYVMISVDIVVSFQTNQLLNCSESETSAERDIYFVIVAVWLSCVCSSAVMFEVSHSHFENEILLLDCICWTLDIAPNVISTVMNVLLTKLMFCVTEYIPPSLPEIG